MHIVLKALKKVLCVIGVNNLSSAQIPEFHTFIHLVFFFLVSLTKYYESLEHMETDTMTFVYKCKV